MNYETFVQELMKCIKVYLTPTERMEKHQVLKNNGVTLTGLSIRKDEEKIAPIIYLDGYYQRFLEGETVENLTLELLEQRKNIPQPPAWDYRAIFDFSGIRNFIIYRLINYEKNKMLLRDIPYMRIFDLAIVFYIVIPSLDAEECSILIRNSHLNLWKISISVLYETAKRNTAILYPYIFQPLREYIGSNEETDFYRSPLWILTNLTGVYGAAAILYPKMPKRIFEKIGANYFLIPSSVHEFLIIPECNEIGAEKLCRIVREVNVTQMEQEEVLGECVYYFDGKNITKM